jgi:hypothetical protein
MNKLTRLELKRNSLKPYYIAVSIITIVILSFLYLLAAIPRTDATDTDAEMFMSYDFIVGLDNIVSMAVFSIMSAAMASKFIVEEYAGKRAIMLFSYPVDRKKIIDTKIITVFSYTVISMLLCNGISLTIFFVTESLFPLCQDTIDTGLILNCISSILCYSLSAGLLGIISLWFGFRKKSTIVTIISACIIASVLCQVIAMTLFTRFVLIIILAVIFLTAMLAWTSLCYQVKNMEV